MPADMPDLLQRIDWKPPEGTTITRGHRLGWKAVRSDLTTTHGYRWPWPGNTATPHNPTGQPFTTEGECPSFEGDGLCLALDFTGAASGGIPAHTILIVSYNPKHVLYQGTSKLRVSKCRVLDVVDLTAKIRTGAYLTGAYLTGAYLTGANLTGANLTGANLTGANLTGADLARADLARADLDGADLDGANLARANLAGANLAGAYGDAGTRLPAGWNVNESGLIVKEQ